MHAYSVSEVGQPGRQDARLGKIKLHTLATHRYSLDKVHAYADAPAYTRAYT